MGYRPYCRGDLWLWHAYSIPLEGLMDALRRRMEPVLRCGDSPAEVPSPSWKGRPSANRPGARQNAVCRVACLEWVWWMGYPPGAPCARRRWALTPETRPAKEAKRCVACYGNHLGCLRGGIPRGAGRGLQYGLSGNSVPAAVTSRHAF